MFYTEEVIKAVWSNTKQAQDSLLWQTSHIRQMGSGFLEESAEKWIKTLDRHIPDRLSVCPWTFIPRTSSDRYARHGETRPSRVGGAVSRESSGKDLWEAGLSHPQSGVLGICYSFPFVGMEIRSWRVVEWKRSLKTTWVHCSVKPWIGSWARKKDFGRKTGVIRVTSVVLSNAAMLIS